MLKTWFFIYYTVFCFTILDVEIKKSQKLSLFYLLLITICIHKLYIITIYYF